MRLEGGSSSYEYMVVQQDPSSQISFEKIGLSRCSVTLLCHGINREPINHNPT